VKDGIPQEFLSPPPDQNSFLHEEVDIKPLVLIPSSPPPTSCSPRGPDTSSPPPPTGPHPPTQSPPTPVSRSHLSIGEIVRNLAEKQSKVGSNCVEAAAGPGQGSQGQASSSGSLSIRKDIFSEEAPKLQTQTNLHGPDTPKKDTETVIDITDSPPKTVKEQYIAGLLQRQAQAIKSNLTKPENNPVGRLSMQQGLIEANSQPFQASSVVTDPVLGTVPSAATVAGQNKSATTISQHDMLIACKQLQALQELQKLGQLQQRVKSINSLVKSSPQKRSFETANNDFSYNAGFSTNVAEFLFRPEVYETRERPKPQKRYQSATRTPLFYDPTLPPGWTRKVSQRMTGATAGGWDTYIMDPVGKRFRSKQEIRRHFEMVGETVLRWEDFDFNPFGSKGQVVEDDKNIPFWEEDGDMGAYVEMGDFLKTEIME